MFIYLILFYYNIGALTSRSSFYTYRSWECEKIESYDPFDANGSTVVYYVYGSSIVKVGPVLSLNSSEWCTDKVRFFIDSLLCSRFLKCTFISRTYVSSLIFNTFYLNFVLSSIYVAYLFSLYLHLSQVCFFIKSYMSGSYSFYDIYTSCMELAVCTSYFKILDFINLSIIAIYSLHHLWLCFGIYKLSVLISISNHIIIIYASLFNYNFPYFFLLSSSLCASVFVFGCVYTSFPGLVHVGMSLFCMVANSLSLYFNHYNVYISSYCGFNLLSCSCTLGLGNMFGLIMISSSVYLCNIYMCIWSLSLYSYYLHISYLLLMYVSYYTYSIIPNYNFFFVEYCGLSTLLDSYFGISYIVVNNDYVYSPYVMGLSNIVIFFSSYICKYSTLSDLVLPMNFFLESESCVVNYYGNSVAYGAIGKSTYFIISDYLYFSTSYLNILHISSVNISLGRYKSVCNLNLIYIYATLLISAIYIYCTFYMDCLSFYILYMLFRFINLFFIFNVFSVNNIFALGIFKYVRKVNSSLILDLYLDSSTYFLTGSVCRMSKFIGRYRSSSGLCLYNLV